MYRNNHSQSVNENIREEQLDRYDSNYRILILQSKW